MARTACGPEGSTVRLKLTINQLHTGEPCDTPSLERLYTITIDPPASGKAVAADIDLRYMTLNAAKSLVAGETITQLNSGATGKVMHSTTSDTGVSLTSITGTFTANSADTLTGSVSGALSTYAVSTTHLTGKPTIDPVDSNIMFVDLPLTEDATTSGNRTFTVKMEAYDSCMEETWTVTIWDRWVTPKTSSCSAGPNPVSEGNYATFAITESNVNKGDTVGYTITGVTSADINGESLTGAVAYGTETCTSTLTASKSFLISTDLVHPETETMTLTWASGEVCSVVIDSVAPPVSYPFSCSGHVTEGGTITWNWSAVNIDVADGTVLNYTITGSAVTDGTITATSGSFTVNSNAGSFTTATIQNTIDDGTRQAIATITNGAPYDQVATCNVNDDDPACVTHWIQAPIAWTPCYNGTDDELESLTPTEYGYFHSGSTQVPTSITVTKGSPSTIAVATSVGIDVTAGQIGTKVQLITGSSSSNDFNDCPAGGPVTGSAVVDGFMRTHY